ncbi:MAG TPA: phage portal protein [Chitinophagaceae bacterium]|nr:phage portal protein [Chitinophagaceae bacterium]
MNWFQKLFKRKGMTFAGVNVGTAPTYFKWDKNSDAYVSNDTIFTVVKKIGRKASSIPIHVYKPKKKKVGYKYTPDLKRLMVERVKEVSEVIEDSDFAKLIMRPNPMQGADAFYEGVFSFYVLRGECFIWLNRGGFENGKPLEMYAIPPDKIELVPDPNDLHGILGYLFDVNGRQVPLPKEDVIHWKTFTPEFDAYERTHSRGFDPLRPLKRRLQQDNDAMEAAVAMFQNGGAKGVLYNETYTDLTPEQSTQMNGVISRKINNQEMKAAVAALQGKWGYLDIGKDSVDMELLKSQQITLERIAMVMGVDPDILITGQSFSNKEWAQKKFVTDLIMPMCNSLRDELNRVLAPSFKEGVIDFDFTQVPELAEDISKMWTVWGGLFDRGVINAKELRQLTGFEESGNALHERFLITGNYGLLEDVQIPDEPDVQPTKDYMD